ncbi:homing endonuclease associated repeat-containing protein [Natrialbaceae archaeon GCM10025810]|uniref:homing endonuclease associated repeat-containing protein n=1 Tax=Halovalidus salilacus TaxID=3075124 RepID=UPI003620A1B9
MNKIPTDDLLTELRRLAADLERTPTMTDMDREGTYCAATYHNRFGAWNAALSEVGLEPSRERRLSDEELLTELQTLAEELGRPPAATDMITHGKYHSRTYTDRFGSWTAAVAAAGLDSIPDGYIPRSSLLDELTALADTLERAPTAAEMDQRGRYSSTTYQHRFGSWNAALTLAGLHPPDRTATDEVALPSADTE